MTLLRFSTEEKPSFLPSSSSSDLFETFMTSPMPLLFFNVFSYPIYFLTSFHRAHIRCKFGCPQPNVPYGISPTYFYTSIKISFTLCFILLLIFYLQSVFLRFPYFIPVALLLPKSFLLTAIYMNMNSPSWLSKPELRWVMWHLLNWHFSLCLQELWGKVRQFVQLFRKHWFKGGRELQYNSLTFHS